MIMCHFHSRQQIRGQKAQEREARRIEEERRQLQLLKEAQEKRRKIDSEPRCSEGLGLFC